MFLSINQIAEYDNCLKVVVRYHLIVSTLELSNMKTYVWSVLGKQDTATGAIGNC